MLLAFLEAGHIVAVRLLGATIYVCGDGGKMEPDVKAELVAIYRERKGADVEAGPRWINDLGTKNR